MKLWKRAAGALKDGNSLIAAADSFEAAVVKATSHDELSMDYDNAQLVYRYVCACPSSLKALVRAISSRVNRTRSWAVALKGLILMHGVFLCNLPEAESIGRLPFDLSSFSDAHSPHSRSWGFNVFVRAYFTFLDQRSTLFHDQKRRRHEEESSIMIQLVVVRKMQNLVDTLIRIKPMAENMRTHLIIDAMDNVIIEIIVIYGRICSRTADVLPKVHSKTGKREAETALELVVKSISQGEQLSRYFKFCKEFHVPKAHEIPDFVRIPEEDVRKLEKLVHGISEASGTEEEEEEEEEQQHQPKLVAAEVSEISNVIEEQRKTNRGLIPDLTTLDENEAGPLACERDGIPDLISF